MAISQTAPRRSLMSRLLGGGGVDAPAHAVYGALVGQARQPAFYLAGGVADTVDGRFDLIALHCMLVLKRLEADAGHRELAQRLQEVMFSDFDRALREMGVGDLSVGKRIKHMADAFYGRFLAYRDALDRPEIPGDTALAQAIARNVFRGNPPTEAAAAALAAYVRRQTAHLATLDDGALGQGDISFVAF